MHVHEALEGGADMTVHPPRRTVISVLVSVSASGSVGGGLTTIGHGNDLTTIVVAVAPTAICGLLCCLAVLVYRAEKQRYLNADQGNRRAIREYDVAFVNLVVSFLTLTRARAGDAGRAVRPSRADKTPVPRPRHPATREAADRQEAS
jgi:hypothetical protein